MNLSLEQKTEVEKRLNIEEVEARMLSLPQVDCPLKHHFGPGVYVREITMPAGSLILGHEHKEPHLNNLISGKLAMLDDNNQIQILEAPITYLSKPGRKIGYILETVVWQTIHVTDETDIEKLEDSLVTKSSTWKQIKGESVCQLLPQR